MKKYLFKDGSNRTTESSAFETIDFISIFSGQPGQPVKTNSSGFVDSSLISASAMAAAIAVSRIANETISRGEFVYSVNTTNVGLAVNNDTQERAMVLGVAMNNALFGEQVLVLLIGAVTDVAFNGLSINRPLYLNVSGGVTDTKPVTGYLVPVAKSVGSNTIFVSVSYPIKLGA